MFDLCAGRTDNGEASLKTGQTQHRLLIALCSDFYRPIAMASLHHALHPGEFYNPVTSQSRVKQSFSRLRQWLSENNLPAAIEVCDGQARLVGAGSTAIRISAMPATKDRLNLILDRLRSVWPEASFSSQEARLHLEVSKQTMARWLGEAVQQSTLLRLGKGKGPNTGTIFRLPGGELMTRTLL